MTQSAQVGRNVRRLRQMILIVSFPSLRILIFFFLFDISLSLITWVVGHAGSLLRRTAPLIFRGQISLALEKAASN